MTRLLAKHPTIQPESYQKHKDLKDVRIKSLYLPSSNLMYPELIFDSSSNIKEKVFYNSEDIYLLPLHPYYHVYIDRSCQYELNNVNAVATYIYRQSVRSFIGKNSIDSIHGDVLFFGSIDVNTKENDDTDYSVPYELVEQVSRYYDFNIVPSS